MCDEWVLNRLRGVEVAALRAAGAVFSSLGIDEAIQVALVAIGDTDPARGHVPVRGLSEPGNLNGAVVAIRNQVAVTLDLSDLSRQQSEIPENFEGSGYEQRVRPLLHAALQQEMGGQLEVWISWLRRVSCEQGHPYWFMSALGINRQAVAGWLSHRIGTQPVHPPFTAFTDAIAFQFLNSVNDSLDLFLDDEEVEEGTKVSSAPVVRDAAVSFVRSPGDHLPDGKLVRRPVGVGSDPA